MININARKYQEIQQALQNELEKNTYSGAKRGVYQNAIKSAMLIIKRTHELDPTRTEIDTLLQHKLKNNNYTGLKRDIYQEGMSMAIAIIKAINNRGVPSIWYGHTFTEMELKKLKSGKTIKLTDCVAPHSGKFACFVHFGRLDDGTMGIVAQFD